VRTDIIASTITKEKKHNSALTRISTTLVVNFSYCGISEDYPIGKQETNELYTIQNIRYLTSEVFSNGAVIGTVDCTIDNEECEKLYLSMELGETEYLFIVVNDNISYDQLKEIAKTFELD